MALRFARIESKDEWETFLLQHAPGALFQSWLWGEVQHALGFSVWRFGFYNIKELVGIVQIVKVNAKRGKFLHIRHGPVFISHEKDTWLNFIKIVRDLAQKEGVWFIRMSPLLEDTHAHKLLFSHLGMIPSAIHAMDGELCWVLDLNKTEDELLQQMRKTTRYEIRRALKLGIQVNRYDNETLMDTFLALYKETSHRHGFVPHGGLREEFRIFARERKAELFLGSFEGKILAGALVLYYGDCAIYHHGASLTSRVPVSYLIQWEAIKRAKERGMKIYNFWGIAPEESLHHPWRGITLFKKGFGGRQISYLHAHDLPLSPLYSASRGIETFRKIMKGY